MSSTNSPERLTRQPHDGTAPHAPCRCALIRAPFDAPAGVILCCVVQGYGPAVVCVLSWLVDTVLSRSGFLFKRPSHMALDEDLEASMYAYGTSLEWFSELCRRSDATNANPCIASLQHQRLKREMAGTSQRTRARVRLAKVETLSMKPMSMLTVK